MLERKIGFGATTRRDFVKTCAATLCLSAMGRDAMGASGTGISALVVGVDEYAHVRSLQGAVNDAQDVAEALRGIGAQVTLLTNAQVSYSSVRAAWNRILAATPAGGTVIFHYAGHSADAKEPTRPGYDGRYDFLLFGGFRNDHIFKPAEQRENIITGHEWRSWIQEAKDRTVITVFDSCSSGRLYRSVQAHTLGSRSPERAGGDFLTPTALEAGSGAGGDVDPGTLPNHIFLAGANIGIAVQEYDVSGTPRGLLSYYFARALRGAASNGGGDALTIRELFTFVRDNIRRRSDDNQDPVLMAQIDKDQAVLHVAHAPLPEAFRLPEISVALTGKADETIYARLRGVGRARQLGTATLQFNLDRGLVYNIAGQEVAQLAGGDIVAMQRVIDKWRYVEAFAALGERTPLKVEILDSQKPSDRPLWFFKGQEPKFRVNGLVPGRNLLIFNLASNGLLQVLSPNPDPRSRQPDVITDTTSIFPTEVVAPFGADHAVFVEVPKGTKTDEIGEWLLSHNQRPVDGEGFLIRLFAQADVRVGMQSLYTSSEKR